MQGLRTSIWMKMSLMTLIVWVLPSPARAFPEFVRHGYFSCTSCHVNPSGGGILTDYGRSYSAEKLSAASIKGEEEALHGVLTGEPGKGIRSWLLIGGNLRQLQAASETSTSRDGRWIPMQRDLEICLIGGGATACATGGITKYGWASSTGKTEYGLRKYSLNVQATESIMIRTGRFSPRFGTMIPDHNAWIQAASGRGIDDERDQLELIFSTDKLEVAVTRDQGRYGEDHIPSGYIVNAVHAMTETIRTGVSYRTQNSNSSKSQTAGIFTAAGINENAYVLTEINHQSRAANSPGKQDTTRIASYVKAGLEINQGLVTYAVQQIDWKEGHLSPARRDMYGIGLQYFPRPHFELDARAGKILNRADFTYLNTAYLLLHYYL